jgi:hypothetical protein
MPTTKTDIWNLALARVGQKPIASPDERTVQALACARAWDTARKEVLGGRKWTFNTVVEALEVISDQTVVNWDYVYGRPVNALALWSVFTEETEDQERGEDFRELFLPVLSKRIIVTNAADAYVEYAYDTEEISLFDPAVVSALSYRLAADIALPLTGDAKAAQNLIMIFNNAASEAGRINKFSKNVTPTKTSSFEDAR